MITEPESLDKFLIFFFKTKFSFFLSNSIPFLVINAVVALLKLYLICLLQKDILEKLDGLRILCAGFVKKQFHNVFPFSMLVLFF